MYLKKSKICPDSGARFAPKTRKYYDCPSRKRKSIWARLGCNAPVCITYKTDFKWVNLILFNQTESTYLTRNRFGFIYQIITIFIYSPKHAV